jgi:hypothetical protein
MIKKKLTLSTMVVALAFSLSACMGSNENSLSPQESAKFKQMMMEKLQNSMNAMNRQSFAQEAPREQKAEPIKQHLVSEEELAKKVNALPLSKEGTVFMKQKYGFKINNQNSYLDSEGQIVNYGYDWQNGAFTYMIQTGVRDYKIKYNTAENTSSAAVDIARVTRVGNRYQVETLTGKKFMGSGLILTSKGFIVLRDSSAFSYTIGEGEHSFVAPDGWHIAAFQNGDVASTGYILLEKDAAPTASNSSNPFADLIESTKV